MNVIFPRAGRFPVGGNNSSSSPKPTPKAIIPAEPSQHFLLDKRKLEAFLKDNRILVDWELVPQIWSTATAAFRQYLENRRRSGSLYYCAACGAKIQVNCPRCGKAQGCLRHILPDFFIGAHALHQADLFLTADKGIPRKYFPNLKVLNPLELL